MKRLVLLILVAACGGSARPAVAPRRPIAPGPSRPAHPTAPAHDGGDGGDDGDEGRDATTLDGGAPGPAATVLDVEHGWATWYGQDWHGKPTASGERFDMRKLTAAHRTLPLGSIIRVTNTRNGKAVEVRINDRGPYGKRRERILDLSRAAARRLDFIDAGSCPVMIEVLSRPPPRRGKR
jgi:hypothetical protein